MPHFIQVYVKRKPSATVRQEEEVMNKALDWYRFAPGCYILYTSASPHAWKTRLAPIVEPEGEMLMFTIDLKGYDGFTAQPFWEWLQRPRTKKAEG